MKELFRVFFRDHTPMSKLLHQVKDGVAVLRVKDYDGSIAGTRPWTEITLEEEYTPADGKKAVSKKIHVTLGPEDRAQLIAYLNKENK